MGCTKYGPKRRSYSRLEMTEPSVLGVIERPSRNSYRFMRNLSLCATVCVSVARPGKAAVELRAHLEDAFEVQRNGVAARTQAPVGCDGDAFFALHGDHDASVVGHNTHLSDFWLYSTIEERKQRFTS
ncbi:hypothetical protein MRX96_055729 [Rhipicephalus microplus]